MHQYDLDSHVQSQQTARSSARVEVMSQSSLQQAAFQTWQISIEPSAVGSSHHFSLRDAPLTREEPEHWYNGQDKMDESEQRQPDQRPSKRTRTNVKSRKVRGEMARQRKPSKSSAEARQDYRAATKNEEDDEEEDPEREVKRQQHLERNRKAANKCRIKQKGFVKGLESMERELARTNKELSDSVQLLREEVLMLKSECLMHCNCSCERIRGYLDQAVTKAMEERMEG